MRGAVLVAFGDKARCEARLAIAALNRTNDLPVVVVADRPIEGAQYVPFEWPGPGARWAKLNVDRLIPDSWKSFAYLDADTRVHDDLSPCFEIVEAGWDVAMAFSANQGDGATGLLWHVGDEEREETLDELGSGEPLQLQAGVMFVRRNERTRALYETWREEWGRWQGEDQAALLRAINRVPLHIWILGRPWNGGALIAHRFGACRRK